MSNVTRAAVILAGLLSSSLPAAADLTLQGEITGADHQTYKLVPFHVPPGTRSIHVSFDYSGREARTTIDLGLLGPGTHFTEQFRGWSGGNKREFMLSSSDATPSYLPGPLTPGQWQLLLGIPNVRADQRATFTAQVTFDKPVRGPTLRRQSQGGWLRGDLHTHSGHSDGTCASRSGKQRVPCPLFLILEAAADRKLDFVAVTEHNTVSHVRELTALQPYYDDLLLVPAVEVTTFQGHANIFHVRSPIDFRVSSKEVPDWRTLLEGIGNESVVSINHPNVVSGESCMGCGWQPRSPFDWGRIQAVEVVNGFDAESAKSGIPFWEQQLSQGHRLTGIGGSDTHDVTATSGWPVTSKLGVPTTVIYAEQPSIEGLLAGIRSGRVFVDVAGSSHRMLDVVARTEDRVAFMGGRLQANDEKIGLEVSVRDAAGGTIEVIRDGKVVGKHAIENNEQTTKLDVASGTQRSWIRVNVRDQHGRLVLVGNPVYINWPAA